MKSTPNKAANAPVLNANQKLHDLVLEYLAVTIEALDWSMVETMEVLLDILTPEDMEQPAAAPAEPAAAIEKKKGSSCLKRMFVGFLFLLAVLLVAMAVSCPSEHSS